MDFFTVLLIVIFVFVWLPLMTTVPLPTSIITVILFILFVGSLRQTTGRFTNSEVSTYTGNYGKRYTVTYSHYEFVVDDRVNPWTVRGKIQGHETPDTPIAVVYLWISPEIYVTGKRAENLAKLIRVRQRLMDRIKRFKRTRIRVFGIDINNIFGHVNAGIKFCLSIVNKASKNTLKLIRRKHSDE